MGYPRVSAIGTATPPLRFTQEQAFELSGYTSQRIRGVFLNSDIDYRHFYVDLEHINRHPGGRKVIDNVQKALGFTDEHLRFSKIVLRNYGNMSSASVLFVLEEVVRHGQPEAGNWGVMVALGPGTAAETALLRW
jgi:predicted naringenin-chalcone synthase